MANPYFGASLLAILLAGAGGVFTTALLVGIYFRFQTRVLGATSIILGVGSFVYLGTKYPPTDRLPGIISYMLSFQQGIGNLFGDVTVFGAFWLFLILLYPVGVGILGLSEKRFW